MKDKSLDQSRKTLGEIRFKTKDGLRQTRCEQARLALRETDCANISKHSIDRLGLKNSYESWKGLESSSPSRALDQSISSAKSSQR